MAVAKKNSKKSKVGGKKQNSAAPKKKLAKFVLDCSTAADDNLFDPVQFESFLKDRIKVDNRTHNLGNSVKVVRSNSQVIILSAIPFSKRYYKYLTKKYLKKVNLRDWLRVVATNAESFELRYFNVDEKAK